MVPWRLDPLETTWLAGRLESGCKAATRAIGAKSSEWKMKGRAGSDSQISLDVAAREGQRKIVLVSRRLEAQAWMVEERPAVRDWEVALAAMSPFSAIPIRKRGKSDPPSPLTAQPLLGRRGTAAASGATLPYTRIRRARPLHSLSRQHSGLYS